MKTFVIHLKQLVPYLQATRLQEHIGRARQCRQVDTRFPFLGHDVLLLLEHTPVYTQGLRNLHTLDQEESVLRATGADYYRIRRGGEITFHGPGQLVGYPIVDLQSSKLGIREHVHRLERVIMDTCGEYGVVTRTTEHTGVWTTCTNKIAALGIHVKRHVTRHGFALNCSTDVGWFDHITPCNLSGTRATSLSHELGHVVQPVDVVPCLIEHYARHYNTQLVPVKSDMLNAYCLSVNT
jgi:lipoyl(octanoyl) transferase